MEWLAHTVFRLYLILDVLQFEEEKSVWQWREVANDRDKQDTQAAPRSRADGQQIPCPLFYSKVYYLTLANY
jgi:hypothetical protein